MNWRVALDGPEATLRQLADVLAEQADLSVTKAESGWVLESVRFEQLAEAEDVRNAALEVATAMSGIARILLGSKESLTIGSISRVRVDGARDI